MDAGWDNYFMEWNLYNKYVYEYDNEGNRSLNHTYYFDNGWVNDRMSEHSYNNDYDISDLILPFFFYDEFFPISHMLENTFSMKWGESAKEWIDEHHQTFYYTEVNVQNIVQSEKEFIHISPNPFTDYLSIQLSNEQDIKSIEFYNSSGMLIYTHQISARSEAIQINLSYLPQGIYFYKINTSDGLITEKLMKH